MSSAREVAEQLFDLNDAGRIMHEFWTRTKRAQHFHHPSEPCDLCADGKFVCPTHNDLVPWEQLPQKQKDINLNAFRDVFAVLLPKAEQVLEAYATSQVQAERERLAQKADEHWRKYPHHEFRWAELAAWLRSQG